MTLLADIARESVESFSDFDEDVTWTPAGGSATTIPAIYDRISEVTDIGEMLQREGVAAMIDVATGYISNPARPGIAHGDVMIVRGSTYRVVGIEPDGTGRTKVILGI
jgi:hypothetical protein